MNEHEFSLLSLHKSLYHTVMQGSSDTGCSDTIYILLLICKGSVISIALAQVTRKVIYNFLSKVMEQSVRRCGSLNQLNSILCSTDTPLLCIHSEYFVFV